MGNDSPSHSSPNLYFNLQIKMLKTKLRFKMGLLYNLQHQVQNQGTLSAIHGVWLHCKCWGIPWTAVGSQHHITLRWGKTTVEENPPNPVQKSFCLTPTSANLHKLINYLVRRRRISCYSFPSWIHVSICLDLWRKTLNVIKFVHSIKDRRSVI